MSLGQKTALTRYGGWYPGHHEVYDRFIGDLRKRSIALSRSKAPHSDAVAQFESAIKSDPEMFDLMSQIFMQVSEENQVDDFEMFLYFMDLIIVAPPSFYVAKDKDGNVIGEPIGVPMLLVFDLLSNTAAAYDLFRKGAFSIALKELLDAWAEYLKSPDSTKTLTNEEEPEEDKLGWFSTTALAFLEGDGRGKFNSTYVCPDENAVNRGFTSYDAFFTRQIKDSVRPIDDAKDQFPIPIYSACESTVYRIQTDAKAHDHFWLKGQRYSLYDMLDRNEKFVKSFVGGTVYQAFLGPADYHRWRSPIDGTIVSADVVPGNYYVVIPDDGAEESDPDFQPGDPHGALIRSQPFLTANCPRAIIYIQASNEDIGLVAFIGVGMAEVSTCELTVQDGQKVSIGDELGMFHFGGSTYALIFGPQVTVTFADNVKVNNHILVKSLLGGVAKKEVPV